MDIPFVMLVLYMAIATVIFIIGLIMGLKKINGAPLVTVFSGLMMFALVVLITNVEVDYIEAIEYNATYVMDVTTGTSNVPFSTTVLGIAEKLDTSSSLLYNKQISCISIDLSKSGSPTGNVIIGILDGNNNVVKQFGTVSASDVSTAQRTHTRCLPNHDYWIITLYDRIGAKHDTSTGTDFFRVYVTATNDFDKTNSYRTSYSSGNWVDTTTTDIRMKLISDDVNIIGKPVKYAFNQNDIFPFTIVLTAFYIFTGVIIQLVKWD